VFWVFLFLKPFLPLHFLLLLNYKAINNFLILNKHISVQCSISYLPFEFKGVLLRHSVQQSSAIAIDSPGVTRSTSCRAQGAMLKAILSTQVKFSFSPNLQSLPKVYPQPPVRWAPSGNTAFLQELGCSAGSSHG